MGYINAEAKSGIREGDRADILTWAATLALFDIGKKESVLEFDNGKREHPEAKKTKQVSLLLVLAQSRTGLLPYYEQKKKFAPLGFSPI